MTTALIVAAATPFLLLCYALISASAPRTPEEREQEDKEQTEYVKQWRAEHKKDTY